MAAPAVTPPPGSPRPNDRTLKQFVGTYQLKAEAVMMWVAAAVMAACGAFLVAYRGAVQGNQYVMALCCCLMASLMAFFGRVSMRYSRGTDVDSRRVQSSFANKPFGGLLRWL